jgi:hypothetical protein
MYAHERFEASPRVRLIYTVQQRRKALRLRRQRMNDDNGWSLIQRCISCVSSLDRNVKM